MLKISKKWSKVAENWLGDKEGRHCHWCEFMESDEGTVVCKHPESQFNDGDRIRGWDGKGCAKRCGFFKLSEWYTKDENFDKYLGNQ